ncbi:hypothetical protein R75465_06132 [Paraburkholderia aspalathi]|uniref:hypothetical protein n=1 Tax=Paraburkholderia aspalathi TaxID=1324617 RepID=UPI001B2292C5|nr:hypothetical protein [Paraburkholderia aspalathi]CAE6827935.1 hypothetical protein R75465_06132 [Paraburkholderia aspalathi]
MKTTPVCNATRRLSFPRPASTVALVLCAAALNAHAEQSDFRGESRFEPGLLVVSRSVYDNLSSNVQVGAILPPNCGATQGGCSAATGAPSDGTYPFVWNNDGYDASFGITSRIFLDQLTPSGEWVSSLEVPNSLQKTPRRDQLVTSFSSKSELGLHLSLDGPPASE